MKRPLRIVMRLLKCYKNSLWRIINIPPCCFYVIMYQLRFWDDQSSSSRINYRHIDRMCEQFYKVHNFKYVNVFVCLPFHNWRNRNTIFYAKTSLSKRKDLSKWYHSQVVNRSKYYDIPFLWWFCRRFLLQHFEKANWSSFVRSLLDRIRKQVALLTSNMLYLNFTIQNWHWLVHINY